MFGMLRMPSRAIVPDTDYVDVMPVPRPSLPIHQAVPSNHAKAPVIALQFQVRVHPQEHFIREEDIVVAECRFAARKSRLVGVSLLPATETRPIEEGTRRE